jgi:hypothetical protein
VRIRIVEPAELLRADPKTEAGVNNLLAALHLAAEVLEQEIRELMPQIPVSPSNVQAKLDANEGQLRAIREKIKTCEGPALRQVIGPAWEEHALGRIFETGIRREDELGSDLGDDPWDVAAWCDRACEAGLIERMGTSTAPRRHWKVTVQGQRSVSTG